MEDPEPAYKRRRIESESAPSHHYIPIAEAADEIEVPADSAEYSDLPADPLPALVKDVSLDHGVIRGSLVSAIRKVSYRVPFSGYASQDDPVGEMLNFCNFSDSIHKYHPDRPPLAAYDINLTLQHHPVSHLMSFQVKVKLLWHDSPHARSRISVQHSTILQRYLPSPIANLRPIGAPEEWSPRAFYDSVYVPVSTSASSEEISCDMMSSDLYPFQRRAVRWLLNREGMELKSDGNVQPQQKPLEQLPPSFFEGRDAHGKPVFVSQLLGCVFSNPQDLESAFSKTFGGILAEEMGLGKTVELIALICLHQRRQRAEQGSGSPSEGTHSLTKSRATLIITPPTILEQWRQELEDHITSSGFKVCHYSGLKITKRRLTDGIVAELADNDVVLTTYNVLAQEIHYAKGRPDRQMRHRPRADFPKSPLTQISWWRVCLDEAQMVESGVSQAAQVARLIPRVNAWAVSGTPIRGNHRDLYGLFLFLKIEPFCQSTAIWDRFLDFYRPLFAEQLEAIAIRHSKDLIRDELRLPAQTRQTITVPFTPIEEQFYDGLFQEMCDDVGLDRSGGPRTEDWDPNDTDTVEKMRHWLSRLRELCLRPDVGGHKKNRKQAPGVKLAGIRTVLQVLDEVMEKNEAIIRLEQRSLLHSQLERGRRLEHANHTERAIELWKLVYDQAGALEAEYRKPSVMGNIRVEPEPKSDDEAAGQQTEEDVDRRMAHGGELRLTLEIKHTSIFFLGNGYFQLKSCDDIEHDGEAYLSLNSQEVAAFEDAKKIRGEVLGGIMTKVLPAMEAIKKKRALRATNVLPRMKISDTHQGIECRTLSEKLQNLCEAMNVQLDQFMEWIDKVEDLLIQPLVDAEDGGIELSGEEYDAAAKHQDDMNVFMDFVRALSADRDEALTGQPNVLMINEMKRVERLAKNDIGHNPQLVLKMHAQRRITHVPAELGSLRGIINELRQRMAALQWEDGNGSSRARSEIAILTTLINQAMVMMTEQQNLLDKDLSKDIELFGSLMRTRMEYYRGMQKFSDLVAAYDPGDRAPGDPLDDQAYDKLVMAENKKNTKIATLQAKHRYYAHLKAEEKSPQKDRLCVICQSNFEQGTLTICGHLFCKECILLWWNQHRSCPVCKRALVLADFHEITNKPQNLVVQKEGPQVAEPQPEPEDADPNRTDRRVVANSIYLDINSTNMAGIKNIELPQGAWFGTKVDTMCRHVLWLRKHDPGSKMVFFSQYRDFLGVLSDAMSMNGIAFARFDTRHGIENFKKLQHIECFLLHARAHSAGLNLVNANHVFLCEPLINTALELQAIARVHRIGQLRQTTVWMYLVAGTVEESIYEISVNRRLTHLKRQMDASSGGTDPVSVVPQTTAVSEGVLDAANSLELQSADLNKLLQSGQSGGEIVRKQDLWQCLYGTARSKPQGLAAEMGDAGNDVGRDLRAGAAERRLGGSVVLDL